MQPSVKRTPGAGFGGYVSEHRFGLMMMTCALVLGAMLVAVYTTVGFGPTWDSHAVSVPLR